MFQSLDSNSVAIPFSSDWTPVTTNSTNEGISNFSGVLGGVEKVTFVQVHFDPLLGTNFAPITYNYTLPWINSNGALYQLAIARKITTPDVLFTAANLNPTAVPLYDPPLTRTGTFLTNAYTSPGTGVTGSTIDPQMLVVLNNVGALYYNQSPYFMDYTNNSGYPFFIWGSFDGTTNAPIVYPTGTSIQYLIQQILEGGSQVPGGNWSPVENPNNTNATSGGGTGGGGTGGGGPGG